MIEKNFNQANIAFRQILTLDMEIPAEFCYFFAESLYHAGQYGNSLKFVEKYYELTGSNSKYTNEIKSLEAMLSAQLSEARQCNWCDNTGNRYITCSTCEGEGYHQEYCKICKGKGKISCTLCAGNGVNITVNVFGKKEYNTCHRCDGNGYEDCPRCGGDGIQEVTCPTCAGTGKISSSTPCDHEKPMP
jgi:DnaJ-class molecular chaperone